MDVHEYRSWAPARDSRAFDRTSLLRNYEQRVRETDASLDALLRIWDQTQDVDESLIAFYSDHGEHLGEPGRPDERHGDSLDEVVLRVPLVVHYPDGRRGVDERPVALVDLGATVLDVAGARDGAPIHGRSLRTAAAEAERVIFADHQLDGDELSAVRAGERKLLVNWSRDERRLLRPGAFPADVAENEWSVSEPERQRELEAIFDAYVEEADAFAGTMESDVEIDAEALRERLRAIGYAD
jgi:arylsulfatase A-like enzyme